MSARTPPPSPAARPDAVPASDPSKPANGFEDEDKEDGPWRHAPVAPKDDGFARSIGKAVSDVVTGPLDDASGKPTTP